MTQIHPLRSLVGLLTIIAALWLTACGGEPLPPGQAEFAEGLEALYAGDTLAAAELFQAAEEADPGRPWRLLGEGRRFEAYGAAMDALAKYQAAIDLAPDFDSGYTNYVRVAIDGGKREMATRAAFAYGERYGLSTASEDTPALRRFTWMRARIAVAAGEYQLAREEVEPLAQRQADDFAAQEVYALALWRLGRFDDAVAVTQKMVDAADSREDRMATVRIAVKTNQAVAATDVIDELREDFPQDLDVSRFVFGAYLGLGYFDYADREIARVRDQGFPEGVVWYLRGALQEAVGEYRRAYLAYEYALSLNQASKNIYRDLARVSAAGSNFVNMETALQQLAAYTERDQPGDQFALNELRLELAEYYTALKQWRPALDQMLLAEESFDGSARLELLRVRCLAGTLLGDSARHILNNLTSSVRMNLEWAQGIARAWVQLNELDSVAKYLEVAEQFAPLDYGILFSKAQLALQQGDTAAYAERTRELAEAFPTDKRALRNQAGVFANAGDQIAALQVANLLLELYPGDLNLYRLASVTARRAYGVGQGREYLKRAIESNRRLPAAYHMFAMEYLGDGEVDSATALTTQALELDSLFLPARLARAVIAESRGQLDTAVSIYTQIINTDPFYAEAYNNLAWLLASNKIDLQRATNLAREAISLSGGTKANMHGTLGWAHYNQDQYKQADVAYQMAIRLDPNDPFKHYLRGINFARWEKKDEAREELQQALDLGISGVYLGETQKALQALDG